MVEQNSFDDTAKRHSNSSSSLHSLNQSQSTTMIKSRSKSARREKFLYMRGTPALSWRLDPDDSLSDWTLRIVSSSENPKDDLGLNRFAQSTSRSTTCTRSPAVSASSLHNPIKTYFVHRTVLGVGPRSSEYFAQLFKKGIADNDHTDHTAEDSRDDDCTCSSSRNRSSVSKNVTKIELLPSAASCFPVMLDYLYAPPGTPLAICSTNAVALRHLSSSFGIKSLFNETTSFIKKDLTPETAPFYLVDARKFKNSKVSSTAIKTIAANFKGVKLTALSSLPSQYLIDIVQSGHLKIDDVDRFSSKLAAYCRCRGDEITLDILEALTAPELMPTIAEEESLYFLQLVLSLGGSEEKDAKGLFTRCLEQAPKLLKKVRVRNGSFDPDTSGINRVAYRQIANCNDIYNKLPDRIKVQLLERSPTTNEQDPPPPTEKKSTLSNVSRNERKVKKQVMKMRNEMEEMKAIHEKKVEYLKQKLGRKDEELITAKQSMKKEKRTSFETPSGCW